jgi:hypothetical protein
MNGVHDKPATARIPLLGFSYRAEVYLGESLSILATATMSSLAIASVVNKTRKTSYLTRIEVNKPEVVSQMAMTWSSASNWLEAKMAGKTDVVTGRVGQLAGLATWRQTQNEKDFENFQLRPIVLLNVRHQLTSIKSIVRS